MGHQPIKKIYFEPKDRKYCELALLFCFGPRHEPTHQDLAEFGDRLNQAVMLSFFSIVPLHHLKSNLRTTYFTLPFSQPSHVL